MLKTVFFLLSRSSSPAIGWCVVSQLFVATTKACNDDSMDLQASWIPWVVSSPQSDKRASCVEHNEDRGNERNSLKDLNQTLRKRVALTWIDVRAPVVGLKYSDLDNRPSHVEL